MRLALGGKIAIAEKRQAGREKNLRRRFDANVLETTPPAPERRRLVPGYVAISR
jgi:hypothetical protein